MTREERNVLWWYFSTQKSALAYVLRFIVALIFFYISICFMAGDILNPFGEYISRYGDYFGVITRMFAYLSGISFAVILPSIEK